MTRTEYDVVALGELLIDFTAQGAGADGYPLMAAHPGGAPANFLAAIARLGGRTALLSKVGADAFGTMLTGTLCEVGVDTRGVVVAEDAFTTLAFVTLDARGERSFSFARKPGADTHIGCKDCLCGILCRLYITFQHTGKLLHTICNHVHRQCKSDDTGRCNQHRIG